MKGKALTACGALALVVLAFGGVSYGQTIQDTILLDVWDEANHSLRMNTAAGGAVTEETTLTNTVNDTLTVTHTTTGTPANGIGEGIKFIQEVLSGNEIGMWLNTVVEDVTAGSEDFGFVVMLMKAGAAATEAFRVTSTGVLTLVNDETIDNTVDGTITYTATTHALVGNVTASGSVDVSGAGGIILQNDETITNAVDGTVLVTAPVFATSAALQMTFVVADPCGTYPEGALFYNDTANVPCFCNEAGDDLKVADGAACF